MEQREFIELCLEWEDLTRKCQEIAAQLEAATLDLGKTQTVGSVRVTFSNPRKSYDYEGTAKAELDEGTLQEKALEFSKTVIDWRSVCKATGLEAHYSISGKPTAKIKLLD